VNLPNYFLADLPPAATLTGSMIRDAGQTLKRNREQYLASRPTSKLIRVLSEVAASWLHPDYPFRQLAIEQGPAATGFSRATILHGLETFFRQVTPESLHALLVQELAHDARLDEMSATLVEQKLGRAAMAQGPELLAHIASGNIPNPTLFSLLLGVLTRSAQFVKCASGASFVPRLFAHSLYDADPKLASCLEIAEWRGGEEELDHALFQEADCVTATGSDETLAVIRQRLPGRVRFLGYGHRVSFGYIAHEEWSELNASHVVAQAGNDIVVWDQHGCLSPHVVYVEHGGKVSAEEFAEKLAGELARRELSAPRRTLSVPEAAIITNKRAFYQIRAGASPETRLWHSPDSTAWTVVYEADPRFQLSCLNRFILVKGVSDLTQALQSADSVRGKVSTVGLAAPRAKAQALATQLARWGVPRVCPLGQMQEPPLFWRHDGRPALGDLVTWTDWEL
jgi:hypothetical protein